MRFGMMFAHCSLWAWLRARRVALTLAELEENGRRRAARCRENVAPPIGTCNVITLRRIALTGVGRKREAGGQGLGLSVKKYAAITQTFLFFMRTFLILIFCDKRSYDV
jgi:hypothetical protein